MATTLSSVTVQGAGIGFPAQCACCLGPPTRTIDVRADVMSGAQMALTAAVLIVSVGAGAPLVHGQSTVYTWQAPVCRACAAHVRWRSGITFAVVLLFVPIALGVMFTLVPSEPTTGRILLAMVVAFAITLALRWLLMLALTPRTRNCTAVDSPVACKGDGRMFEFSFTAPDYASAFRAVNTRASRPATKEDLPRRSQATRPQHPPDDVAPSVPDTLDRPGSVVGHMVGSKSQSASSASAPSRVTGDAILVVMPVPGAATRAQEESLTSTLGVSLYDARALARGPLPHLTGVRPAAEQAGRAVRLCSAGFECVVVDPTSLDDPPREVRRALFDGSYLHLAGAWGEVRVNLERGPAMVVSGKVLEVARGTTTSHSVLSTPVVRTSGRKASAVHSQASIMFAHLFAGGDSRPFELTERSIGDWSFLGLDKAPGARVNLQTLLRLMSAFPGVIVDDLLLRHPDALAQAVSTKARGTEHTVGSVSTRSSAGAAATMSRVLYHAWVQRRGIDATALAASCETLT